MTANDSGELAAKWTEPANAMASGSSVRLGDALTALRTGSPPNDEMRAGLR